MVADEVHSRQVHALSSHPPLPTEQSHETAPLTHNTDRGDQRNDRSDEDADRPAEHLIDRRRSSTFAELLMEEMNEDSMEDSRIEEESHLEERESHLEERESHLEERKSHLEERESHLEGRESHLEESQSHLEEGRTDLQESETTTKVTSPLGMSDSDEDFLDFKVDRDTRILSPHKVRARTESPSEQEQEQKDTYSLHRDAEESARKGYAAGARDLSDKPLIVQKEADADQDEPSSTKTEQTLQQQESELTKEESYSESESEEDDEAEGGSRPRRSSSRYSRTNEVRLMTPFIT